MQPGSGRQEGAHVSGTADRIQLIATVLIQHGTVPGPSCHCGHRYRLGASIAEHRATVLDAALTLHEAGSEDHDNIATLATESARLATPSQSTQHP